MISQTSTPPATMARNPRTTITAIAQCGKGELPLDSWMLPVWEDDEARDEADDFDATDATDTTEAVEMAETAERVDCTEREEREDCDIDATTESAYVVSGQRKNHQEPRRSIY